MDRSLALGVSALLTLINTNRMRPAIAPVGLEYVAEAAREAGVEVQLVDLGLTDDPRETLRQAFSNGTRRPDLVGLTLRNVDDCFWPSAQSFLPELEQWVAAVHGLTEAPICLGGVGFSIFARPIVERSGVEFGIHGDGERAVVALVEQIRGPRRFDMVPGLLWRENGTLRANRPAWDESWSVPGRRDLVDNRAYFAQGGQIGVETKRGCPRQCCYCADPLAKGFSSRQRDPARVADEFEALLRQGIDVFHLCDSEFNLPRRHAVDVCDELIRRRLGDRMRWYAYLAVSPFDADLARRMRRAGCVGINFTADSAAPDMLDRYGQPHRQSDLAAAVAACRQQGITVMLDLLLGGPGETPETAAHTIRSVQQLAPDCAGAALGLRLYPGTPLTEAILRQPSVATHPGIRRRYLGPLDLARPTFYIAPELGPRPARLIGELIGADRRFFPPADEEPNGPSSDHNYNANDTLVRAIAAGARGAYWDILRKTPA